MRPSSTWVSSCHAGIDGGPTAPRQHDPSQDTGAARSVSDIARQEKLNTSYASRVLRTNLLAPYITETILVRRQAPGKTLLVLMRPSLAERDEQIAGIPFLRNSQRQ